MGAKALKVLLKPQKTRKLLMVLLFGSFFFWILKITRMSRFLLLLLFLPLFSLSAQHKLNADLMLHYQKSSLEKRQNTQVEALAKGSPELATALEELGIARHYRIGKELWRIRFPLAQLPALLEARGLQRVEAYRQPQQLLHHYDSIMALNNRLLPVHRGQAPLPQPYTGQGVLLGLIDDGFDWQHPDFLRPNGSTRVRYLWDQEINAPALAPAAYGYGAAWDSTSIEAGQSTHAPLAHGSHVAGTAGGNGRAANKYIGMAPESELAWVAVRDAQFMSSFVDAVHFLFDKADELQLPCSINSSVGTYVGSHDGLDLYAQAIDFMLEQKNGRVLTQAAGNARGEQFHLRLNPQLQTQSSAFVPDNNICRFTAYADSADWEQLRFRFQLLDSNNLQFIGGSPYYRYPQDFTLGSAIDSLQSQLFTDGNGNVYELLCYTAAYEGGYEILFELRGAGNGRYWLLELDGPGTIDIWSHPTLTGTAGIVPQLPLPNYVQPDDEQSIVSSWTCSDKVITVASYQNRDSIVNYSGNTLFVGNTSYPMQDISHFSSKGPTRDGRLKPDIAAPGGRVLSAAPVSLLQNYRNSGYIHLDEDGWHILNQGTSMSAPMVAGAVALYLQCQPGAGYQSIKEDLEEAARLDAFVAQYGSLPNADWGHGKLDVFAFLQKCLIYGCTDSTALNYNPNANVDDGSCQLISSLAETENKAWRLQPNPARQQLFLEIPEEWRGARLHVYNLLGQLLEKQELQATQWLLSSPAPDGGWYFYELQTPEGKIYGRRIFWQSNQ